MQSRATRLIFAVALLGVLLALAGCRGATVGQTAAQAKPGGSVEVDRERIAREATWAPGQLRAHFEKHGDEGPWPSESAYDGAAREAIRLGTAFTYQDREANVERLGFYLKDANRFAGL